MNKYNFLIAAVCLAVVICAGFLLSGSTSSSSVHFLPAEISSSEVVEEENFSLTVAVTVPNEIEFAGKQIKLDRYDLRERFDREINSFTYYHSTTLLMIKRANRYFPVIEPILKAHNIPDDFKYMAVIESHLEPKAVSPAKATGVWQFMEETGKRYGLVVNSEVDERYHVEKSTVAACKYLKEAMARYGDWTTVAASYNAGMGRINSELSQQQVNTSLDLLLVEETSRYVFRIYAIKQIFEQPRQYGFRLTNENLYPFIPAKKVEVTESVELTDLANKYNLTYAQLKEFNPWLRDRKLTITPGKSYIVNIPEKSALYYNPANTKVHDRRWVGE